MVPISALVTPYLETDGGCRILIFHPTRALDYVEVEVVLAAYHILEAPGLERPGSTGGRLTLQTPVEARSSGGGQDF